MHKCTHGSNVRAFHSYELGNSTTPYLPVLPRSRCPIQLIQTSIPLFYRVRSCYHVPNSDQLSGAAVLGPTNCSRCLSHYSCHWLPMWHSCLVSVKMACFPANAYEGAGTIPTPHASIRICPPRVARTDRSDLHQPRLL